MHCNFANHNNKETRKNNNDGTNLKELKSFSPGIVIFNSLGVTKCFKNWIRLHRVKTILTAFSLVMGKEIKQRFRSLRSLL